MGHGHFYKALRQGVFSRHFKYPPRASREPIAPIWYRGGVLLVAGAPLTSPRLAQFAALLFLFSLDDHTWAVFLSFMELPMEEGPLFCRLLYLTWLVLRYRGASANWVEKRPWMATGNYPVCPNRMAEAE